MRTTISLPEPLLDNAKRLAAERGITVSVLLADALREHLAHVPVKKTARFRLHTVKGRLVRPGLDLDRTSALVSMDDEEAFGRRKR